MPTRPATSVRALADTVWRHTAPAERAVHGGRRYIALHPNTPIIQLPYATLRKLASVVRRDRLNNRSGTSVAPDMTDYSPLAAFWDHLQIALATKYSLGDRALRSNVARLTDRTSLHHGGSLFVNFYNLPETVLAHRAGGGAEAENNRMMFTIARVADGSYGASQKVKIEMTVSALGREHKLRAKTGKPDVVAEYLASFLAGIVASVPPRLTHSG
jgi:hypothetical protein